MAPAAASSGASSAAAASQAPLPAAKKPPPKKAPPPKRPSAPAGATDAAAQYTNFSYFDLHFDNDDGTSSSLKCEWSRSGQHTLTWNTTLSANVDGKPFLLRPGTCNIYKFPAVKFRHFMKDEPAENLRGERLELLLRVVHAILQQERELFELPDASGATTILGLLVANTEPAVGLCMGLYKADPTLLLQCHAPGPFFGENAYHVLVVNSREDELCALIELAEAHLDRPQLEAIFWSQAEGVFFNDEPMSKYGESGRRHIRYMPVTCRLHAGYMPVTCRLHAGYMPVLPRQTSLSPAASRLHRALVRLRLLHATRRCDTATPLSQGRQETGAPCSACCVLRPLSTDACWLGRAWCSRRVAAYNCAVTPLSPGFQGLDRPQQHEARVQADGFHANPFGRLQLAPRHVRRA